MEMKDVVKTVACLAVIGVITYAYIKDIQRGRAFIRIDDDRETDPFWENVTERKRIDALEDALRRETDPEVRKELVKQLNRRDEVFA